MSEYLSVENVILENKALSNYDLIDAVKKLKIKNFRGVFLRDQLPYKCKKNECGIVNLKESPPGTHWVCYFRESNKKGKRNYYFDSYGLPPPLEIINYLEQSDDGQSIEHNIYQIQRNNTVICGHLCLYVLKKLNDGNQFNDIILKLVR